MQHRCSYSTEFPVRSSSVQVIAVGPGSVQVIRFREGLQVAIQDQVLMQLSWTVVEIIQMETRAETQWE